MWNRQISRRKLLTLGGAAVAAQLLGQSSMRGQPQLRASQVRRLGLILPAATESMTRTSYGLPAVSEAAGFGALASWFGREGPRNWFIVQADTPEQEARWQRLLPALQNHVPGAGTRRALVPEGQPLYIVEADVAASPGSSVTALLGLARLAGQLPASLQGTAEAVRELDRLGDGPPAAPR